MITTLSTYDFTNNERLQRNFSYDAIVALFDYFEDLEQQTGDILEFDPVSICCEFTEYNSLDEACMAYIDPSEHVLKDASEAQKLDYLLDITTVIECESGSIILLNG